MLASLIAVLVDSVIKFQNYSTTTAFSLKLVEKLPFPSISVCNNVRVSVIVAVCVVLFESACNMKVSQ